MAKDEIKQSEGELQHGITTLDGWAIGTGGMIGVTIFVVCGSASGYAGPSACLGFLIAAALVFCVALCYCEISSAAPESGGAYLFPKKCWPGKGGKFLSFISGWCLWGGQGIGPAVVTVATVSYIAALINLLTGGNLHLPIALTATVLTLLYLLANWFGGSGGRALQLITTFIVVGVLLVFIIWGGVNMNTDLLTPFAPGGFSGIITATCLCILGYGGWSTIPNMAGEFRNPTKDVPKATLLSLLTCGVLFAVFAFVMNGLLPGAELAASDSPPVAAMNTFTTVGAIIISIGGICACISTSNGLMMTGCRIPYAMGKDGDLPKGLAKINKKGIPGPALILTAVLQIGLCWTGSALTTLVSLVVAATSVSWVITVCCSISARRQGLKAPFRVPGFWIIAVIGIFGLGVIFWRLAVTNTTGIIMCCIWIVIGIIVYFLFNKTGLKKYCNDSSQVHIESIAEVVARQKHEGNADASSATQAAAEDASAEKSVTAQAQGAEAPPVN